MNDWELLRQYVQTRSQPAFAQLVERHVRWVHAACARQVRDAHLAEDVTQSVFLLLSQKAARLKPQTSITGWLFRTARLMSSNAMKMQRRRVRRDTRAAMAAQASARAREGEQASSTTKNESEMIEAIDAAMTRLRAQDRDVLLLRFYGNKGVSEVADELEISIDAAKKRFARSLDALRQALTDQGVAVPAVGGAMMILSAVAPTSSQAVPATLSTWIAAGATPATVSARAAAIVRWAGMKKLLTATLTVAIVMLASATAASVLAWSVRPRTVAPAVATPLPPASSASPAAPVNAAGARAAPQSVTAIAAPTIRKLNGHASWMTNAVISSDGRFAVSRSLNEILRWDLQSAAAIGAPVPVRGQPFGLAIAAGGQIAAVDGADLLIFDEFRAAEPRRLPSKTRGAMHWSLALSADGKLIAAGGTDGGIRVIHRASGDVIRTLRGHAGVVSVVAFSPDHRTLLSGGFDFSVRLCDVESGKELQRFDGHTSAVHAVAFSPDGGSALSFTRTMVTPKSRTEADRFVRVWDVKGGGQRCELAVPSPSVHAAAFTPDGRGVVALVAQELIAWDLQDGREVTRQRILPETSAPTYATFSRDVRQLLVDGDRTDKNAISLVELNDSLTRVPARPAGK